MFKRKIDAFFLINEKTIYANRGKINKFNELTIQSWNDKEISLIIF